jgi:hypothetical protein
MDQQDNGVIVVTEKQIVFRNQKAVKLMTEQGHTSGDAVSTEESASLSKQLFYEYIDSPELFDKESGVERVGLG